VANPLGAAPSILTGAAIGGAAAVALEPLFEPAKQKAWAKAPNRILDAGTLARLVAQGGIELDAAHEDAALDGYASDKLDALIYLAQSVPGFAEALALWRRGTITDSEWHHTLAKAQLDARYWDGMDDLRQDRLSPPVVALAIVRGIMDDPGFLPVGPPSVAGNVKPFPTSPLDSLTESAATGFDSERLRVLTAISGRPMGPEAAASAVFRGILLRVDFDRAVSEGDVRNEWADSIFETQRQIPSVADYIMAEIRGWITTAERNAGIARHGMSPADGDLLYLRTGRPAAPGQMATAIARGVDGPDGTPMDEPQFLKGIRESDIRPEWGEMLYGIRYQYPPLFQLTRLVTAGAVTPEQAAEWAKYDRYAPEVVEALLAGWKAGGSSSVADPHLKSAATRVINAARTSYINGERNKIELESVLIKYVPDEQTLASLLEVWDDEKAVTVKPLTPSQIKKLYTENTITLDDAVARLEAQGRTDTDATLYLKS
jgi:hypothetical protein